MPGAKTADLEDPDKSSDFTLSLRSPLRCDGVPRCVAAEWGAKNASKDDGRRDDRLAAIVLRGFRDVRVAGGAKDEYPISSRRS